MPHYDAGQNCVKLKWVQLRPFWKLGLSDCAILPKKNEFTIIVCAQVQALNTQRKECAFDDAIADFRKYFRTFGCSSMFSTH